MTLLERVMTWPMTGDPGGGGGGDLSGAAAGMEERLAGAFDGGGDGAPVEGEGEGGAEGGFDPKTMQGNMLYKDAQALRQEVQQSRQKWGPLEQAFGQLDDAGRQALLEHAPNLGGDLSLIAGTFGALHPQDRQILLNVIGSIGTDPGGAAEALATIADELRGAAGLPPAAQMGGDDEGLDDGLNEGLGEEFDPESFIADNGLMTQDQFQQMVEEFQTQQLEQQYVGEITTKLGELGYVVETDDPIQAARTETVLALARRFDGDLDKAHEALQQVSQATINGYVDGKRQDGARPLLPSGGGATPSGEQDGHTLQDAEARMNARLDAAGMRPARR